MYGKSKCEILKFVLSRNLLKAIELCKDIHRAYSVYKPFFSSLQTIANLFNREFVLNQFKEVNRLLIEVSIPFSTNLTTNPSARNQTVSIHWQKVFTSIKQGKTPACQMPSVIQAAMFKVTSQEISP